MHTPSFFTVVLSILLTGCASTSRVPPPASAPSRSTPTATERLHISAPAKTPTSPAAYQPSCRQGKQGVPTSLVEITHYWHTRRVMYNSAPLSDCSGMFHRVVQSFQEQCPGYPLPHSARNRTSRQIATWYARHGRFTVVTNPRKQAHLIRPGMVMFYGQNGKRYAPPALRSPTAMTRAIGHLGVIVAVTRDRRGRVQSYHLFHGRRPGKPAAITTYHTRNHPTYPFGNGAEQWIGIAPFTSKMLPSL